MIALALLVTAVISSAIKNAATIARIMFVALSVGSRVVVLAAVAELLAAARALLALALAAAVPVVVRPAVVAAQ